MEIITRPYRVNALASKNIPGKIFLLPPPSLSPSPFPRGNAHGRLKEELEVTERSFHALFAAEKERERGKRAVRVWIVNESRGGDRNPSKMGRKRRLE